MSMSMILKELRLELSRLMGSLSVEEIMMNQNLIHQLEIILSDLSSLSA